MFLLLTHSYKISNLPLDIEEDDLRILLVRQGVINQIKLYLDNATGNKSGKALIIFAKPESVVTSMYQFDNVDIDGYHIKVVRGNSKLFDENLDLIVAPGPAVTNNEVEKPMKSVEPPVDIVDNSESVEAVHDDIDVDNFLNSLL